MSHVRDRRARPALEAFRRVIDAVASGRTGGHEDPRRLEDLAWMSVARLYYSLAMQPGVDDARGSELLGLAIAAWRRIPLSSEYWLDSFFEETWALYVAREYGRALGHVHALTSPYFRDRADPEALVIRAMIYFEHCQWDAVDRSLTPLPRALRSGPGRPPSAPSAWRTARERLPDARRRAGAEFARAGRGRPCARGGVRGPRARAEPRAGALDCERGAPARAPRRSDARTTLQTRVTGDLAVSRSFAEAHAGELARARIQRLARSLNERMTQMDTIELELATARRDELERPNRPPMGPPDGGRIVAVQGDQIWIWDGEWWRDELPFYIQEVRNRCSR